MGAKLASVRCLLPPAFSVNNHRHVYQETPRREGTGAAKAVRRITLYAWPHAIMCPQKSDSLTSGVFFLNSRLRSISFFLVCSLSSCLLASCVAVASSSFYTQNTNTHTHICNVLRKDGFVSSLDHSFI